MAPYVSKENGWRVGGRALLHALAYGVATFPTSTSEFKEGANLLFVGQLFTDKQVGASDAPSPFYLGVHASILSHHRHVITSRGPGPWRSTQANITELGIGPRAGVMLNRFDVNSYFAWVGSSFVNYLSLNVAYRIR